MNNELIMDFYFWVGRLSSYFFPALAILCLVLLAAQTEKEQSKKIVLWPSIVCAILALIIFHVYAMELYVAYSSRAKYEMEAFKLRITGPYWFAYVAILISTFTPILLFFGYFRKSLWTIFVIALIGSGAFFWERFVQIVTTLPHFP